MRFSNFQNALLLMGAGIVFLFAGCQPNVNVEVVDLNKVLDVFEKTLAELDGDDKEAASADDIKSLKEEDKEKENLFLTTFATNLNKAKIMKDPVGVEFANAGTINGFTDKDGNNQKSSTEKQVFTLDLDMERNRVVATDNNNHYRDYHYRPRFGFFSGYMLGSMLSRSNSYYSGPRATAKPDYSKKTMSPKNYHSSAVAKAKSAARSSYRSRSGSRGFSFGK